MMSITCLGVFLLAIEFSQYLGDPFGLGWVGKYEIRTFTFLNCI